MGDFKNYCASLYGEYHGNLGKIVHDSTERLFELVHNNNLEIAYSKNITPGKFYIIKYNYNGNKIWCPIFVIDDRYSTKSQKRILYAINLEYLSYDFKILLFDILFKTYKRAIDYNKDQNNANKNVNFERHIDINFEKIYKLLKTYNRDYAITAYDYMKIDGANAGKARIYGVSTNFTPRFIFVDTKKFNITSMRDLSIIIEDLEIKRKLGELIELFENIENELDEKDQEKYYKKLKDLESKYKLYENL
jgi:hypothetical protein